MSRTKSKQREVKRLARMQAAKVLGGTKPATPITKLTPAPVPPVQAPPWTPAQLIILDELRKFHIEVDRLFARATYKMMAQGLKEGGNSND